MNTLLIRCPTGIFMKIGGAAVNFILYGRKMADEI